MDDASSIMVYVGKKSKQANNSSSSSNNLQAPEIWMTVLPGTEGDGSKIRMRIWTINLHFGKNMSQR